MLFVFGLLMGALDRDLAPFSNLGPWFAAPMRLPGAEIAIAHFPKRWTLGLVPAAA